MSDPRPAFSVVIPTYNRADLLPRALDSVLEQEFTDFEIIVVDNSSSDGTDELLADYQRRDARVRSITVSNQGNIADSRNTGLRAARAKWACLLDSDDRWLPGKLASDAATIAGHPGAVLVCHYAIELLDGVPGRVLRFGPAAKDMERKLLIEGNCVCTSATAVHRRTALDAGGFGEDPEIISSEDYDLWIRLARRGEFVFVDRPLVEYRVHAGGISANAPRHARSSTKVWVGNLRRWAREHPEDRAAARDREAQVWAGMARFLLKHGEAGMARRYALRSLAARPLRANGWACLREALFPG